MKNQGSDKAPFRERRDVIGADDKVIEYSHIDQRQCITQTTGDCLVCPARLRHTRRVIVKKDNGGGVAGQRLLDDDPGMDLGPVDRALKMLDDLDDAVTIVEVDRPKYFVATITEFEFQEIPRLVGTGQNATSAVALCHQR